MKEEFIIPSICRCVCILYLAVLHIVISYIIIVSNLAIGIWTIIYCLF